MTRLRSSILATPATVLLLAATARAADPNPCQMTAQATFSACQASASGDTYIAVATCDNNTTGDQRNQCVTDALSAGQDAQNECSDQNQARLSACQSLGGAAWAPQIKPEKFVAQITNPYMPMVPGTTFVYNQPTPEGLEVDTVVITHDTRLILGVTCTVVRDTVTRNGAVTEDTIDWFAQDIGGNVWYFGEDTRVFEDGVLVDIGGSWMAGRDGAQPGIVMEGNPKPRDFYRQEILPGEAEDAAQVKSLSKPVTVAYGTFPSCLKTDESTALEPGQFEHKFYAPGVGNVLTIDVDGSRQELVDIQHE